jgi:hypothetical protein
MTAINLLTFLIMYDFLWNEEAVLWARMMEITTISKIMFSKTMAQRIQTWWMYICIDVRVGRRFNINNVVIKNNIYIYLYIYIIHASTAYM